MHRRRIDHSFAIAATPVTVEQFYRFRKGFDYLAQYSPTLDCPIHAVSWYHATEYCNWLSHQEGLPETEWCYEPNADRKYEEGMKLAPHYLSRTGYRLPTEAEWEYACRAGATTCRYYGASDELLPKYAWFISNSDNRSWPVCSLKPNDWGLFDMLGNIREWCTDLRAPYMPGLGGKVVKDREDIAPVVDKDSRVLRSASFGDLAMNARSAFRAGSVPTNRAIHGGLRVVRTIR
jgi:formylglycine-generating enzyme required for sulfatase activity